MTTQIIVNTHHERTGFAYVKTKVQISCAARLRCRYQIVQFLFLQIPNFKLLAIFYSRAGRFVSDQVRNPKDWFSHIADHFISSLIRVFFFFLFNSVLRPFQDYLNSYETCQSVGGRKRENPAKIHQAHPQAELGLSHMCPVRGSNPHQTQQ